MKFQKEFGLFNMDNNIYVVKLQLFPDINKMMPKDTTFPNFRVVMTPPSGVEWPACGFSVMIQFFEKISEKIVKAYLKFIIVDAVPAFSQIGMKFVLTIGSHIIAEGSIEGVVNDSLLFNKLVSWNNKIPKK